MFEPKTYWEKRAALTESLVQHLLGIIGSHDQQLHAQIQDQWAQSNGHLKNFEVRKLLGDATHIPKDEVASRDWIYETMQQNFGTYYFGGLNVFENQPTAIGEQLEPLMKWVGELPDMLNTVNDKIEPGFWREFTGNGRSGVGMLFVTNGFLYALSCGGHVMVQQLSLNHLPQEWTWRNGYYRSEFFDYRDDLTRVEFLVQLAKALKAQGITTIYADNLKESMAAEATALLAELEVTLVVEPLRLVPKPTAEEAGQPLADLGMADALAAMEAANDGERIESSSEEAPVTEESFENDVVVHDSTAPTHHPV